MKRILLLVLTTALAITPVSYAQSGEKKKPGEIDRPTELRLKEKSQTLAWALSFFVGFGAGNYYAASYPSAIGATVGTATGLGLLIDGGHRDNNAELAAGTIIWAGSWVFDWVHAIIAAKKYNRKLYEKHAVLPFVGYSDGVTVAGFSLSF